MWAMMPWYLFTTNNVYFVLSLYHSTVVNVISDSAIFFLISLSIWLPYTESCFCKVLLLSLYWESENAVTVKYEKESNYTKFML